MFIEQQDIQICSKKTNCPIWICLDGFINKIIKARTKWPIHIY
jgi:hypothetical protein